MSHFLALFAAFTIGAMAVQIHNERQITDLKVGIEQSYDDGFADGTVTEQIARENANVMPGWICRGDDCVRIEEDDPLWDCRTMGNKSCQ